jgi:hypothetical protein
VVIVAPFVVLVVATVAVPAGVELVAAGADDVFACARLPQPETSRSRQRQRSREQITRNFLMDIAAPLFSEAALFSKTA